MTIEKTLIHKSLFFTGKPIAFDSKLGLGSIKQPTIGELMDMEMDISAFIEPFYLEAVIHDEVEEKSIMNTLYAMSTKEIDKGLEPILMKFQKSLSLIYDIDESLIKLDSCQDSIIIKILDGESYIDNKTNETKYKTKYIIDDDNIHALCKVVLEMTNTEVVKSEDDNKMIASDEIKEKFKRFREEERKRKMNENRYIFYDMCNQIIHMQSQVDYSSIMKLTIWQFKNTYEVLIAKEISDNVIKSGSVKYDSGKVNDWRKLCKIK